MKEVLWEGNCKFWSKKKHRFYGYQFITTTEDFVNILKDEERPTQFVSARRIERPKK